MIPAEIPRGHPPSHRYLTWMMGSDGHTRVAYTRVQNVRVIAEKLHHLNGNVSVGDEKGVLAVEDLRIHLRLIYVSDSRRAGFHLDYDQTRLNPMRDFRSFIGLEVTHEVRDKLLNSDVVERIFFKSLLHLPRHSLICRVDRA